MKKIFTRLTGIALIVSVLISVGCNKPNPLDTNSKKTTVYLKAVRMDAKKHLKMYNSNKPDHVVVDTLETLVMPGDTVIWEPRKNLSKIDSILKVGPVTEGEIINADAEQIAGTKQFRFIIPDDAPSGREKYVIEFKDKRGKNWTIDPYLRIPNIAARN